jgi:RNA polymerase sigma factor (TIGR02999 family)
VKPVKDVTQILSQIQSGDPKAAEQLLPLVYDELRRLAARQLAKEPSGQTLQATALVHEAYLRLVPNDPKANTEASGARDAARWEGKGHFYAAAAEAMRRILIERARRRNRRGGPHQELRDDPPGPTGNRPVEDLLAVDEALQVLAAEDPQRAEVVKLRFYAGLSLEEAAACMGISRATAARYWAYARAWLRDRLQENDKKP